jgi:hypothetical protein
MRWIVGAAEIVGKEVSIHRDVMKKGMGTLQSLEQLIEVIEQRKLRYQTLTNPSQGRMIVLEHGARVIGLFPSDDSTNALWVNPDFATLPISSWNSGGDRIWLSPEIEFNIPELAQSHSYEVQRSLDPGYYEFQSYLNHQIILHQTVTINAFSANCEVECQMHKTYQLIPDPMISIATKSLTYDYVGYQQFTELTRRDTGMELAVSLWSLMQVPFSGKAYISTHGLSTFTDFIDDEYHDGVSIDAQGISMEFRGQQRRKISVKSIYASGRIGYLREMDDNHVMLIVRQFEVNPASFYPDVRLTDMQDTGYCVQCYKDDGSLGDFGELEYHSPSGILHQSKAPIQDKSQVWCYRGNQETIRQIAGMLLGSSLG